MASLKEGEWSCYRCQFNGEHGHVTGVASLMEREWSFYGGGQFNGGEWTCYRGGKFNGWRIVMLRRWPV